MEERMPAWLLCEDMLNRTKNELITETMEELNKMTEEKVIEVNGALVELPDRSNETERDMFVINRLLEEYLKIKERYQGYVKDNEGSKDPAKVQNVERLKRFLLSLDTIATLMHYSHVIDDWQHDVAMKVQISEPAKIISETIKGNDERQELLKFALASKTFEKEDVFTPEETRILEAVRG